MSTACAKAINISISGLAGDSFPCFVYSYLTIFLGMIIQSYPISRLIAKLAGLAH